MTTPILFKEYIWLVETIHKAKKITLAELNERWLETEMSGGVTISRTTFYKHRCEVEELLRKAPERLFQLYLVNRYRFATHLYYSRLSQRAYDRLLTLLAVREAMLAKQASGPAEKREAEPEEMFSDDERIIKAVNILKVEGVLKHMYDYTFVMQLMNETEGMPHYDTPQSFLKHFAQLGIAPLPDVSSINRIFSKMVGKFPNWTFVNKDKTETVRRNNVGRRYLNAYKNEK